MFNSYVKFSGMQPDGNMYWEEIYIYIDDYMYIYIDLYDYVYIYIYYQL